MFQLKSNGNYWCNETVCHLFKEIWCSFTGFQWHIEINIKCGKLVCQQMQSRMKFKRWIGFIIFQTSKPTFYLLKKHDKNEGRWHFINWEGLRYEVSQRSEVHYQSKICAAPFTRHSNIHRQTHANTYYQ